MFLARQVQRFDVGSVFVCGGGVGEGIVWPRLYINPGRRTGRMSQNGAKELPPMENNGQCPQVGARVFSNLNCIQISEANKFRTTYVY